MSAATMFVATIHCTREALASSLDASSHAPDARSETFAIVALALAAAVALAPHDSSARIPERLHVRASLLAAVALALALHGSETWAMPSLAFAVAMGVRSALELGASHRTLPLGVAAGVALPLTYARADGALHAGLTVAALGVGAMLAIGWTRVVVRAREPFAIGALVAWVLALAGAVSIVASPASAAAAWNHPVALLGTFAVALVSLHSARTLRMHRDAEAMGIELGDALRSLDAARDHVASLEHARNEILTHTATTVREPLGLLLSTLEPLTQSTMLGFEARGPVEQAIRLGKEASYGASAIADATLLRTGTLTLEPMAVDVCGLVDDALDAIRRRQEVVAPRFHVHAESDVPYVFADPERLAQVLATLFGRAAALSPDGAAMIRIEGVQETVQITLEDRRASSEPDRSLVNAPALPSSQGAASPIADLRLWIAGRIMRLHGYPIVCQPRDDDEGFRWIVKLPRSKVESIAPSVTTPVDSIRTLPPAAERVAPRVNLTIPSSNGVTFVPGTRRSPLAGALAPQALPKLEFSSDGDSPLSTRPRISLITPASITRGIFDSDARVTLMPASLKARSVHAPAPAQSTAEVAGYRPRVLVADDDPVVRNVVAAQLGELDVDVTMAVDGVDALARIQSETPFDLVLSDVLMPRLTGLQLCKIIRETHSTAELPFVLMSSNALKEDIVRAFEAGASDFMTKPTVKEELLQRIATHLQISKETNALTRFVPREFLRLLGRDRVADVRLGDHVAKDLTILFADIRGFTAMSEAFGPAGTFRFLNQCLSRIAPHIHANGGFIDKYIGDALMALFPTNAIGAVRAAVAIQAEVAAYNLEHDLANDDSDGLAIGVGIFRGPTMLGTIGEPSRFEATVISDAVNVAARLEALTRRLGVRVLIGETVLTDLAEASFALRPLGRVVARGRGEPVAVWELLDAETDDVRGEKTETMETFLAAVDAFERGAFAEAIAAFDRVLEQSPNDGPSWIYQQACQRFLTNEIPFGFRGALDFGGDK